MSSQHRFQWHNTSDRRLREVWKRPTGAGASRAAHGFTIRPARAEDTQSLRRLAALDSAEIPAGGLLVAEVSGELWAAVDVSVGHAVADPFRPTAELVRLLQLRATQLRRGQGPPAAPRTLTRGTLWRWRSAA